MKISEEIRERLFSLADAEYREFHKKLIPNVDEDTIIGVRVPAARKLAREMKSRSDISEFLSELPHKYFDENHIHSFIIADIRNYDEAVAETDRFLPYVDNWATCDSLRPKVFKKNTDRLIFDVKRWISSDNIYTKRFGLEMLMTFFLDEHFNPEYHELAADIKSDEYYINMMIAWYFATALAKQYDATIGILEENRLDKWVHNKTIQKAVESYRISKETKAFLKTLKR